MLMYSVFKGFQIYMVFISLLRPENKGKGVNL